MSKNLFLKIINRPVQSNKIDSHFLPSQKFRKFCKVDLFEQWSVCFDLFTDFMEENMFIIFNEFFIKGYMAGNNEQNLIEE